MIKAIATRGFSLDGKSYAAGGRITLPPNQFNDLSAVGLVEAAPEAVKRPKRAKSSRLPTPGNVSSNDGAE